MSIEGIGAGPVWLVFGEFVEWEESEDDAFGTAAFLYDVSESGWLDRVERVDADGTVTVYLPTHGPLRDFILRRRSERDGDRQTFAPMVGSIWIDGRECEGFTVDDELRRAYEFWRARLGDRVALRRPRMR